MAYYGTSTTRIANDGVFDAFFELELCAKLKVCFDSSCASLDFEYVYCTEVDMFSLALSCVGFVTIRVILMLSIQTLLLFCACCRAVCFLLV